MDAEAMRRAGYATVDALIDRLTQPTADPVLRRATPAEMRARLGGPPPEQAGDYPGVLARLLTDVLPYASRTDHPGYFAFIPSFTTWPAALAELTAAAANPYCGAWMESAGPAQVELEVIDWFRSWLGMPASTAGVLVSGGSAANLTALLAAREAAGGPSGDEVVYVLGTDSLVAGPDRAGDGPARRPGPGAAHRRELAAGAGHGGRRGPRRPRRRAARSRCAAAAARRTPAPLTRSAAWPTCARWKDLWLHVDAAYGGFAALTDKGRALLAGIERADSVTWTRTSGCSSRWSAAVC